MLCVHKYICTCCHDVSMVKTKSEILLSLKLHYIVIYDLMGSMLFMRVIMFLPLCKILTLALEFFMLQIFSLLSHPPVTCFYLLSLLVSRRKEEVCLDVALNMSSGQTGWRQSQVRVCHRCLFPSVSLLQHQRKLTQSDTDISEVWSSGSHWTVLSIFCQTWSHEKERHRRRASVTIHI